MSNASRDDNRVPTLLATLDSDGTTIVPVHVSATRHTLKCSNGGTGVDNGPADAPRDQNHIPALLAVSSVDGITPVAVYADSTGKLLIDTM